LAVKTRKALTRGRTDHFNIFSCCDFDLWFHLRIWPRLDQDEPLCWVSRSKVILFEYLGQRSFCSTVIVRRTQGERIASVGPLKHGWQNFVPFLAQFALHFYSTNWPTATKHAVGGVELRGNMTRPKDSINPVTDPVNGDNIRPNGSGTLMLRTKPSYIDVSTGQSSRSL